MSARAARARRHKGSLHRLSDLPYRQALQHVAICGHVRTSAPNASKSLAIHQINAGCEKQVKEGTQLNDSNAI